MLDEGSELNIDAPTPPEESNNRTFLVVGGIFAALILLTLLCAAAWLFWLQPSLSSQQSTTKAFILTQNAQVIEQMTSTAQAAQWTQTLPPTYTVTITPPIPSQTQTPVVAASSPTSTFTVTTDPATLAAAETQLSQQLTSTAAANATRGIGGQGMPTTGFFDEVGLPGLLILSVALVAVIFLARRLRKVPAK